MYDNVKDINIHIYKSYNNIINNNEKKDNNYNDYRKDL